MSLLQAFQDYVGELIPSPWWGTTGRDDPARGYGDAASDTYTVTGVRKVDGPVLARFEPFVLYASVAYQRSAGDVFNRDGITPVFTITPFETDGRDNRNKTQAPRFDVDGGLIAVPFAAQVQLRWTELPANVDGSLSFCMVTYGPARRGGTKPGGPEPSWERWPPLAPLGLDRWHVTRWLEPGRTTPVPAFATRFRVSDSSYGVSVALHSAQIVIPAPFADPVSLGGSPNIAVALHAPMTGVFTPGRVPVEFYY